MKRLPMPVVSLAAAVVSLAGWALCAAPVGADGAATVRLVVRETSLTNGPVGRYYPQSVVLSDDCGTVACVARPADVGACVSVNGVRHKTYGRMGRMFLSRDGKHTAYSVTVSGPEEALRTRMVIDGEECEGDCDNVVAGTVAFSPDSRHVTYGVMTATGERMYYDGVAEPVYSQVLYPVFSRDSRRWAYIARVGRQWFQVIDGVPEKFRFDQMRRGGVVFSPDSKRVAYVAYRNPGKREVIVVDGVPSEVLECTHSPPVFSTDSKHVAYTAAQKGRGHRCYLNGKPIGKAYDGVSTVLFTTDNRPVHVGFDAKTGNRIVIGGVQGQWAGDFFSPGSLSVSPVGNRTAFGSGRGPKGNTRPCYVIDDKPQRLYDELGYRVVCSGGKKEKKVEPVRFSPDGRRYAYRARRGLRWVLVVDGEAQLECTAMYPPVFSPDSRHVACWIRRRGREMVALDGRVGREYETVHADSITFSPDGRHLAYVARTADQARIVADGVEATGRYAARCGRRLVFTGDDTFRVVMARPNQEFVRVDVRIADALTTPAPPVRAPRVSLVPPDKAARTRPGVPRPGGTEQARAWLQLARNYIAAGAPAQGRTYLDRIVARHGDTAEAREARKLLKELDARGK
ncbi:MAG: hypothetical protein ACYS5V_02870 [Planctomycetota bacterium]|jgi:rRNA maturation protein Nop10